MVRKNVKNAKPRRKRVTFDYHAPEAKSVLVTGSFCEWTNEGPSLVKDTTGKWQTTLMLFPGYYEYRFVVDGDWAESLGDQVVPNEYGSQNYVLTV